MFPMGDVNPTRITPWLTVALILVNLGVYFGIQARHTETEEVEFLYRRAAISCEITTGDPLSTTEITDAVCLDDSESPVFPAKSPWVAVFSSMFLHGSIGHVLFNMWFLWIFGNNVEEAFRRVRYLLLYLSGGVAATAAFVFLNRDSVIPLVGASGAIAAVLGAYAVLFPRHRIRSLVGWMMLPVPAWLFLGFWFVAQFGLGGTNIAWEAHAGGFVFGLLATLPFRRSLLRRTR